MQFTKHQHFEEDSSEPDPQGDDFSADVEDIDDIDNVETIETDDGSDFEVVRNDDDDGQQSLF